MKVHVFCMLNVLCASTLAHAAASHPLRGQLIPPQSPNTVQGSEGGFWRTDKNFEPTLHLKNVLLKQSLDVSPRLIFADGTEFELRPVHLEPASVVSINLALALHDVPQAMRSHISTYGMAGISYRWAWPAVIASIQNTDEIDSLSGVSSPLAATSVVHAAPLQPAAQVIRGTWWKPTAASDEVIAIGNTSLNPKQATLRVSDRKGSLLGEQTIRLAGHATSLLRLSVLAPGAKASGDAGDVTVSYVGPPHSIVVSAGIEDESRGYSATPRFIERRPSADEEHTVTLHAPGVMLGKADTGMLFPVDTYFTPYEVLHNLSAHALSTTLSLTSEASDGKPMTRTLGRITLAPGETTMVDMTRYFDRENRLPDGYGNLSVAFRGRNEDLLLEAGSVDQTLSYVFQVNPAAEAPTVNRIFCFWSIEGDTSSMISVWNYADKPQDATLTLYYSGGTYRIPVHLEPRRSFNLDLMTLVRSRKPDMDGHLIPDYIKTGSATLVGPKGELDRMHVVTSASVYNVRNGTCFPICENCGGIVSVSVSLSPTTISANNGLSSGVATITTASGTETATSGDWASDDDSVATADGGDINGVGPGETSISFTVNGPPGVMECYDSASDICESQNWVGSDSITVVKPTLSGISPPQWPAAKATGVTVSGTYFGAGACYLIFSPSHGVSAGSAVGQSDTQFKTTITVATGTPSETVNVTASCGGFVTNSWAGSVKGQ